MKLSTKTSVLKSKIIEITSPRILESPDPEIYRNRTNVYDASSALAVLSVSEDYTLIEQYVTETAPVAEEDWGPEVSDILAKARAEADELIAEAQKTSTEIIENARKESEALTIEYQEKVKSEITPVAFAEGYNKGLEEAQSRADLITQQATNYLDMAQKVLTDESNRADRELADLCLKICSKIIHTSLDIDPELLLGIIKNLTLLPSDKQSIKIHLSSRDWDWYKNLPSEYKPSYPVIIDETIKAGDTFLECSEGIFDARIELQLEKIEKYLKGELKYGRLEGAGPEN
ncbi:MULTISPECIES: FliH/SctL family protein [unclassified Dehalobacter]|uniref:FliH/SctL family protein n=1 Tax=unclassified Dehalobacter TaxID=2635733 RepID=UPI000E6D22CB|nr:MULTISPECIES: FliH/SctL family protein [unclassified Dehalobacter]RJE48765.1 flagellar assembly protein FliH [Dehalobacter sp. MCB1]TCX51857.1 flagellar assembly protein FliH [Dehalobacter sp. 14DCB1]TCX52917.1 flagellar assembly protein FliH [Dehalobacter sp. 12DCB1]